MFAPAPAIYAVYANGEVLPCGGNRSFVLRCVAQDPANPSRELQVQAEEGQENESDLKPRVHRDHTGTPYSFSTIQRSPTSSANSHVSSRKHSTGKRSRPASERRCAA